MVIVTDKLCLQMLNIFVKIKEYKPYIASHFIFQKTQTKKYQNQWYLNK